MFSLRNANYIVCVKFVYQENDRLRQDMVIMEKAITERLGYLQRHKASP